MHKANGNSQTIQSYWELWSITVTLHNQRKQQMALPVVCPRCCPAWPDYHSMHTWFDSLEPEQETKHMTVLHKEHSECKDMQRQSWWGIGPGGICLTPLKSTVQLHSSKKFLGSARECFSAAGTLTSFHDKAAWQCKFRERGANMCVTSSSDKVGTENFVIEHRNSVIK